MYEELRAIVHETIRRRLRNTIYIAIRIEHKLQNADDAPAKILHRQRGLALFNARG